MGKSYKQLSLAERALLQTQLVMRWSPAAIAAGLQRARSTITREMARNGWLPEPEIALRGRPRVAGGYRAEAAQQRGAEHRLGSRAWCASWWWAAPFSSWSFRICAGA